jgi:hypothetical protein
MDASIVVSETDAAHSSSEDEDHDWLKSSSLPPHQNRLPRVDEQAAGVDENDDRDSDDDEENVVADELYCANMDDEDEAWVYKYLRSGKEEPVFVRTLHGNQKADAMQEGDTTADRSESRVNASNSAPQDQTQDFAAKQSSAMLNEQTQKALLLKPRNSDAVLSCPRCFTTVCMDCQQHEKYANQYRAMFVMNIGVDWNKRMIYDDALGGLKLAPLTNERSANNNMDAAEIPDKIPHDLGNSSDIEKKELYYSVHCGYCQWEVAALDMSDEIYYFFGCIASG